MTPASWHVVRKMFCGDTPTSPEVIVANTLNLKPNFKFLGLKFLGGTPVPLRVCAIKAWSISSAYKIFRAQHPLGAEIVCQKVHFSGSKLTWNSKPLVDQSSPDFFSSNAGGIAIVCNVSRFWISSAVPEIFAINQSLKWSKIDPKFCMFLAPGFFFGECPPNFGLAL